MVFEDRRLAPYRGSEAYLFLSYSHRDAEQVEGVIRNLKACGFRVWYDEGLTPGKEWDENIAHTIMACSYFIVLMSGNYLASANCRDELNYARDKSKPLLLMYLEKVALPAGMELRLGRLLAIHSYRYTRESRIYDKILKAEGIETCRDAGVPIPDFEEPEPVPAYPLTAPRRARFSALRLGVLLVPGLFLTLGLCLKPHEYGKAAPPPESAVLIEAFVEAQAPVETVLPVETGASAETGAPGEDTLAVLKTAEIPEPEPAPALSSEEPACHEAQALRRAGRSAAAVPAFHRPGDYEDAAELSRRLRREAAVPGAVSIGIRHAIVLRENGAVYAGGKPKTDTAGRGGIVAVGGQQTVGLGPDGTPVAGGADKDRRCDVRP